MFKKISRDILIVFGLVVLWASTSRTAMKYLSDKRDANTWWGTYQYLDGDLVSMSYLNSIKMFNVPNPRTGFKHPAYNGIRNTELYLDGDSHTWHLGDSDFAGLSSFHYFERIHGYTYHLDTTKRNILVIEISERYLQDYFSGPRMFDEFFDSLTHGKTTAQVQPLNYAPERYASVFPTFKPGDLFNKYINQNLQSNLFDYNFIRPAFEYKAALNYYVFNRASGDVVISNDRKFLFYRESVSKEDRGSSYYPVSEADARHVVDVLNQVYDHYRDAGFSEIYISLIPNSATIVQPEGYNNLIPMVQNDARLKMKVIDIYTAFKNSNEANFLPGDTHWSFRGKQLWLDMVNERLKQ